MPDPQPRYEFTSTSPEQTLEWGGRLGKSLVGGLTIALIGPLGAGKTHLVKGIAAGNGQSQSNRVTSPTFTLIQEYAGRFALYHLDAYRLLGSRELLALGFEELIRPDSVVIVEWADKVQAALPDDALYVRITPGPATDRTLTFHAQGKLAGSFLQELIPGQS